jgi:hypothetical protein
VRVELACRALRSSSTSASCGALGPAWSAVADHRVEAVADGHDPGAERDRRAGKPVRVAPPSQRSWLERTSLATGAGAGAAARTGGGSRSSAPTSLTTLRSLRSAAAYAQAEPKQHPRTPRSNAGCLARVGPFARAASAAVCARRPAARRASSALRRRGCLTRTVRSSGKTPHATDHRPFSPARAGPRSGHRNSRQRSGIPARTWTSATLWTGHGGTSHRRGVTGRPRESSLIFTTPAWLLAAPDTLTGRVRGRRHSGGAPRRSGCTRPRKRRLSLVSGSVSSQSRSAPR